MTRPVGGKEVASHPDYRRNPKEEPERERERYSTPGEVDGPKNVPLKHGVFFPLFPSPSLRRLLTFHSFQLIPSLQAGNWAYGSGPEWNHTMLPHGLTKEAESLEALIAPGADILVDNLCSEAGES